MRLSFNHGSRQWRRAGLCPLITVISIPEKGYFAEEKNGTDLLMINVQIVRPSAESTIKYND
jgi:hypothetical protein